MDNRYTSCDVLIHLGQSRTNAFGTIRKNRKHLPEDAEEIFAEVKEYNPGEFQSRYSKKAGLVYEVIKNSFSLTITYLYINTFEIIFNNIYDKH